MGLSVGIVGLPNVGKSTLFNALLKKQLAFVANYPFATIEPNIGIVPVPDNRLDKLQSVISKQSSVVPPIVPATVEFVDIAGLIKGASQGEGLGNKFLSHIREVDAICHVVRAFKAPDIIKQGVTNPKSDFETVKTELDLADLEMVEKHKKKKNANENLLPLLSKKPILIVINGDEEDLKNAENLEKEYAEKLGVNEDQVILICAKTEAELAALPEEDQVVYLNELGVKSSGLARLIQKAYITLGLISFLTAGEKEVRAWTIKNGIDAQNAAGVIHTDFIKKFIKADIADFNDFVEFDGWKHCRELGKVRSEGRDYIMKDGDVVEFKIGA
jgi:small GTP-binding protein